MRPDEPATVRDATLTGPAARHAAAVARTLAWADEAAARGDHGDALAWLDTLLAIGETLPEAYGRKRETWQHRLRTAA